MNYRNKIEKKKSRFDQNIPSQRNKFLHAVLTADIIPTNTSLNSQNTMNLYLEKLEGDLLYPSHNFLRKCEKITLIDLIIFRKEVEVIKMQYNYDGINCIEFQAYVCS